MSDLPCPFGNQCHLEIIHRQLLGVSQKHILVVCLLFKQECWDGMHLSILPVLPFLEWCAWWHRSRGRRWEGTTRDYLGVAEWGCITRESRELFGVDEERDPREFGSGFCFSPTYSHIWTEYHWTEYYWTEYYWSEYHWTHHFSSCSKHSRYNFLHDHSACAILRLPTLMQSSQWLLANHWGEPLCQGWYLKGRSMWYWLALNLDKSFKSLFVGN